MVDAAMIVKYETGRGELTLTSEDVLANFCPKATHQEVRLFLELCRHQKLNPWLREAYLIKYGDGPASMVVGKDAFTQRAETQVSFDGMAAGVIVLDKEGKLVERQGALTLATEVLLAGWAEVFRKDRRVPFRQVASLHEFNRGQAQWKSMPATMIRKVALVQALREAFPSAFAGLYDEAEILPTGAVDVTPPGQATFTHAVGNAAEQPPSVATPVTLPAMDAVDRVLDLAVSKGLVAPAFNAGVAARHGGRNLAGLTPAELLAVENQLRKMASPKPPTQAE